MSSRPCVSAPAWSAPGGRQLSAAAGNALRKIEAVLPPGFADPGEALYAPNLRPYPVRLVGLLRGAVTERRKARFDYTREDGAASLRTVWPLGLFYWGAVWTLVAWCELREGHRQFHLDRIENPEILAEPYLLEPGRRSTTSWPGWDGGGRRDRPRAERCRGSGRRGACPVSWSGTRRSRCAARRSSAGAGTACSGW